MSMAYFGSPWPSPFCEDAPRVITPAGEICVHCEEPISPGDSGVVYANGPAAHRNCFLRATFGSVAHIEKRCSCFVPSASEADPPGLTKRQAADAAVEKLIERGELQL